MKTGFPTIIIPNKRSRNHPKSGYKPVSFFSDSRNTEFRYNNVDKYKKPSTKTMTNPAKTKFIPNIIPPTHKFSSRPQVQQYNRLITNQGTIRLSDKVVRALILMAEYNYVTAKELLSWLGNRNTVYEKLTALERGRLILSFETGLMPKTAYCLSARGYHFLAQNNLLKVSRHFKPSEYRPVSFAHTLACIKTQLALEQYPTQYIFNYEPTRILNQKIKQNPLLQPDAEFTFLKGDDVQETRGAVEVELTRKSLEKSGQDRNEKRYLRYETRKEIEVVIWVCGNAGIRLTLQKILQGMKITNPDKHRFILLANLIAKTGSLEVQDYAAEPLKHLLDTTLRQGWLFGKNEGQI